MRTGNIDLSVAPYTTDADLVITPRLVFDHPLIENLLFHAEFVQEENPGMWFKMIAIDNQNVRVELDIMVPSTLVASGGRRSARIPPHDKMVARKVTGLEGAVFDFDLMQIASFDSSDDRRFLVRVAGPAALLIAKTHKVRDRIVEGNQGRIAEKDAADIFRLMIATPMPEILSRLEPLLSNETSAESCRDGLVALKGLFGARRAIGVVMASNSLRVGVPADRIADVCTSFVRELITHLGVEIP